MSDIINIDQFETIENIEISVFPTYNEINVNRISGGGGGGGGAVSSVNGQVGDVVLTKSDLGLGNVDNTSDVNKPISNATQTALDLKVDKITGKGLSTNDYTTIEKTKLSGIQDGAEVNVNPDWNATTGDALILNKPTIPSLETFVPYTGATSDLDLGTNNLIADHIALNVSPSGAGFIVGATQWNNTLGSSETLLKGGNVILKNGVDLLARVVNKVVPNITLTKASYQVVKVSGAIGQKLAVDLAQANTDLNSADTLGIVVETIATNQEGFIMTVGQIEEINTTGSLQGETWLDGDVLYLSPTIAGRVTNIKPTGATGHIVILGYVEHSHATQGKIYVKIMNGWELDELHNVYISSVADKQLLSYDSATQLWKNKSVTTADIADSTDKRYCTDAQKIIIGNTSGTNTGDQDLTNLVVKNTDIVGATKPKITFDAKGLVTAGSDLIASDIPTIAQSQVTNLVSDLAGKQATLSYSPYRNIQTSQTVNTGTTAETLAFMATIPAGAFNSTDIIRILFGANKINASGTYVLRLRINTTNNIATAPTLAFYTGTSTAQVNVMMRNFNLNGGNLYGFMFSSSSLTDIVATGGGLSSTPLNPANQFFIFATVQINNIGDSIIGNMLSISN